MSRQNSGKDKGFGEFNAVMTGVMSAMAFKNLGEIAMTAVEQGQVRYSDVIAASIFGGVAIVHSKMSKIDSE